MSFLRFAQDLRARRGEKGVVVLATVGSTNDLAKRIVRDYAREGDATPAMDLVSWQQECGRGRDGRKWVSHPGGGIYASMVRPLASAEQASVLPIAVAVGLGRVLNRYLNHPCRLKWPNDLLVAGRKLGGVLIEVVGAGEESHGGAAIGFGVNTALSVVEEPALNATSVAAERSAAFELGTLAADLLDGVDECLAAPFDEMLEAYRGISVHEIGDLLRVRGAQAPVEGTFCGFDHRGFLRLGIEGGEERILAAGELHDGSVRSITASPGRQLDG